MRFLGNKEYRINLAEKIEDLIDSFTEEGFILAKKTKLAIEKKILKININKLPLKRRQEIYSRIKQLENIDYKANFFNLDDSDINLTKDIYSNNINISALLYLKIISDDELFNKILSLPQLAKLLMNTTDKKNYINTVVEIKDNFGIEYLNYIMNQSMSLGIIDKHRSIFNPKIIEICRDYINVHKNEDNSVFFRNLTILNSHYMYISSIATKYVKNAEDILDLENCYRGCFKEIPLIDKNNQVNKDKISTYVYGIQYNEIKNLVSTYGKDLNLSKVATLKDISRIEALNPQYSQQIIEIFPIISMMRLSEKEIEEIDKNRLEELNELYSVFEQLKDMKRIIDFNSNDMTEIEAFVQQIKEKSNGKKFINYFEFQSKIIKLFENEYNRKLYNPVKDAKKLEDLSEKLGVDVYEIDYDRLDRFNAIVRVDNAFHKNIRLKKGQRYEANENIKYDGMATSYINSENLTFTPVEVNDIISGYSYIDGLQNVAPWNFFSRKSILENLSPEYVKNNNKGYGIEFHFPNNLCDQARLANTELTFYNYKFIDGRYQKKQPNYYLYEIGGEFNPKNPKSVEVNQEKLVEISKFNPKYRQWLETKNEASYFKRPILLFNREKILEINQKKIEDLKEQFYKCDDIDEKIEFMEQLITSYENCSNSVNNAYYPKRSKRCNIIFNINTHGETIKNEFFKSSNRRNFYDELFNYIKNYFSRSPEQAIKLLKAYKRICKNELSKLTTNTLYRGSGITSNRNLKYILDNFSLEKEMVHQLDKIELLEVSKTGGQYISFSPSDDLKELMKAIRKPIGKEEHYNVPGAIHGVEHPDKVMILCDAIAKMEGLSEKDRRIAIIAGLLHDWERVDNTSNLYHGEDGAKLIIKEFKKGNLDFLGLTKEDIPMLATAVCYHNYHIVNSKKYNKLDNEEINDELNNYGIKKLKMSSNEITEYIKRTKKICAIVRDADNLDRFRFPKKMNTERPSYSYLLTESAKSVEIRTYANFLNQHSARVILQENYPNKLLNIDENIDYVDLLWQVRQDINKLYGDNYAENCEKKIPVDELWEQVYSLKPRMKVSEDRVTESNDNDCSKNILNSAIEATEESVRTGTINTVINRIKAFFINKTNQQEK